MPDDLYGRDILIWSGRQAALLRRLAAGERVNEAVDWPNLTQEVEDVGRAELHACESLLRQAMLHLLKLHSGADAPGTGRVPDTVARVLSLDAFRSSCPGRVYRRPARDANVESKSFFSEAKKQKTFMPRHGTIPAMAWIVGMAGQQKHFGSFVQKRTCLTMRT